MIVDKHSEYRNKVDFRELLARVVQDTLFNNLRLELQKSTPESKQTPQHWKDFLEAIKRGEPELFRKLKGAEKIASRYGCYYAQFELWRDTIKINFAVPGSKVNNLMRLAQGEGFNAVLKMNWYKSPNGGELTTQESYTNYDVNRVVMITTTSGLINNGIFVVQAPEYILAHNKTGVFVHDYGVLPVYQFLNKNDIDFWDNEEMLSDWWVARRLFDWLNYFWFKYVSDELDLDTTRIIGRVSYQDLFGRQSSDEELALFIKNPNAYKDSEWYKSRTGNYSVEEVLTKKLIIQTPGDDSKIEKMQSTFNGTNHIDTFMKVLNTAMEMSGYSWEKNAEGGNYENTASVMNVNKTIYQTTKMKKIQREADWYRFLERIATAYFKKIKGMSLEQAEKEAAEIRKYILFEIISNMLNDYLKGDERVINLRQVGLMSLKRAIKATSPDLSEEQLEQEINDLNGEHEKEANMLNDAIGAQEKEDLGKDTKEPQEKPQNA